MTMLHFNTPLLNTYTEMHRLKDIPPPAPSIFIIIIIIIR